MIAAVDQLRSKADVWKALGEEHAEDEGARLPYTLVELVLREIADALEQEAA